MVYKKKGGRGTMKALGLIRTYTLCRRSLQFAESEEFSFTSPLFHQRTVLR